MLIAGTFSRSINARFHIEAALGTRLVHISRRQCHRRARPALPGGLDALVGWGSKPSGLLAQTWAQRWALPCWKLEDGFLRSVGDGTDPQSLSLVVDDEGIYYDARQSSRLERLIAAGMPENQGERVVALRSAWRRHRLSKYNHAREAALSLPAHFVLVVDQTFGDCSVQGALAGEAHFARALEAALDEHPAAPIILKTHPDVFAGRKKGFLSMLSPGAAARVRVLGRHCHAPDLLEHAAAVYTVSSQLGFEALLWERPVRVFGMPFYAGWGLTHDDMAAPARRRMLAGARLHAPASPLSMNDVVHAALIAYPRYIDPESGERCEVERVIAHIALQRRMQARFPPLIHAIGFSQWKRPIARAFFSGSTVRFVRSARSLPSDAQAVACWGAASATLVATLDARRKRHGRRTPLITVEDGFLRSVGLGARLVSPLSWVLDDIGLHYDSRQPCALERHLACLTLDDAERRRAAALRRAIVANRISKYNLAGPGWSRPHTRAPGAPVVLVIGQVENDAAVQLGSPIVTTNLALLQRVRAREPDAHIVFKPHPDVVAGLRPGHIPAHMTNGLCDSLLSTEAIADVLPHVDRVHVMTSTTGFEALLYGKQVVCHGNPFYGGWGLTTDLHPFMRRARQLTLDELVAGALIRYPRYLSATSGRFTTVERALVELAAMRNGQLAQPRGSPCRELSRSIGYRWRMLCQCITTVRSFLRRGNRSGNSKPEKPIR